MKTEYKIKHLSSDEMIRLVNNSAMNGEADHAHEHLKECSFCSEAYDGLKAMPDLKSLEVLNSKWKLKSGIKPSPRKLEINLPALYTLLTLIGLISIAVIYFFFFNPSKYKTVVPAKATNVVAPVKTVVNAEHFIVKQNVIEPEIKTDNDRTAINNTPVTGTYDEIKMPDEPLEKLQPITAAKEIPDITLDLIKGNTKEQLLNIEDFKIIDYSNAYAKNENTLLSFSEGLSARYETRSRLKQDEKEEQLNISIVSYEEVIARALRNYKKGRFTDAVSDFNFILKYFPQDKNAQFYKALCFKDDGQYQNAIDALTPLAKNNTHTFYQEAKWHLALCYGSDKASSADAGKCEKLLVEIINEGGFYKQQAIDEMRKRE